MNDHDITAVLERLIEPLEDEVGSWDDVLVRAAAPRPDGALDRKEPAPDRRPALEHSRGRDGRRRHRRRVLVVAVAALVVVVGTASALATVRALLGTARTAFQGPTWSPDGRRISFLRHHWDDNGRRSTDIYVMNADGSGLRKLTDALDPGRDINPTLSPGWRKVAFWRNPCDAVKGTCMGKQHDLRYERRRNERERTVLHGDYTRKPMREVRRIRTHLPNDARHPQLGGSRKSHLLRQVAKPRDTRLAHCR